MKKVERLIALLYLLKRRQQGLRTREIAEELGITERTVYRDIASLNEAFKDYVQIIYTETGYYLDRTIYAPPLRLIARELEALNSVVQAIEKHPQAQLAQQALSKMKSAYAATDNLDILNLETKLLFSGPTAKDKVSPDLLLALETYIAEQKVVELDYYSFSSQEYKSLLVHPYALALRKNAWYLIAYSEKHQKTLQLRVFRIQQMKVNNKPYYQQENFDLKAFFTQHWSVFQGKAEEIVLKFDPKTAQLIQELEWHSSETIEVNDDQSINYSLQAPINPELISWILGWGGGCTILSPDHLRDTLIQETQNILNNYPINP